MAVPPSATSHDAASRAVRTARKTSGKGRPDVRPKSSRPVLDWIMENQIQMALSLIAFVLSTHALHLPSRSWTEKFIFLSYRSDADRTYKQGTDDIYFVLAWIINFTALRAICIEWILRPTARAVGVAKKNHLRFAEQGWLVIYYGTFWALGMYLWYNSPYWLSTNKLWTEWPAREMSGLFKWYYLVQFAFWIQQILVVNIEEKRRDYAQMFTHHIITCSLILITYVYRYLRVANVILCLMDLVDVVLPAAKLMKYLNYETACNAMFGVFVVSWFFTRHVAYNIVAYNIYMDIPGPNTMEYGCYSGLTNERIEGMDAWPDYGSHLLWPFQDLNGTICLNPEVKWIFLTFLLLLQVLSMVWFTMIVRVIIGILRGGAADDVRSDDEEAIDEEEEEEVEVEWHENGNGNGNGNGFVRRQNIIDVSACASSTAGPIPASALRKREPKGHESRRTLLNAEDRKELLRRIGCEKPQ